MPLWLKITLMSAVVVLATAGQAFAYDETASANSPARTCTQCHGLNEGETSPTVGPSRKGPHGNYTAGTSKCQTCHSVHSAASSRSLLPAETIYATCTTCHDGTGGGGVYGVVKRVLPDHTPSGHRIGVASNGAIAVPGGNADGSALNVTFLAENGGLTCTDCHSPHDSKTVKPFVGDRLRSGDDANSAQASNRLLRMAPTSGDTPVEEYGSEWCESCHKGAAQGTMNHPVARKDSDDTYYNKVQLMQSIDSSTVAENKGPLGGSNLGYVVPEGSGGKPICQQCHEDSRSIANDPTRPLVVTEQFQPALDGEPGSGNPRFQNFPHETVNAKMLVETRDSLCLNCHDKSSSAN
jgi:predicted CXXCH cytochrome family protein